MSSSTLSSVIRLIQLLVITSFFISSSNTANACPAPSENAQLIYASGYNPASSTSPTPSFFTPDFDPSGDAVVYTIADSTASNANYALQLKPGQQFLIQLKSNPTTGYSWTFVQSTVDLFTSSANQPFIHYSGCQYERPTTPMIGGGGYEFWWFTVPSNAPTASSSNQPKQLNFKYDRPFAPVNEADLTADDKANFIVKVAA